ncbi:MAG: 2-succinyl-6-hydroxy-2,4-cyclohexadiene-1-carboxylate synthase [Myxococcota bacterium]
MDVETRDGDRIRVDDRGDGPATVLLHGFTGSAAAWGRSLLERLARGRRVLAVDLPGHGRSARPVDPARYALQRVLDDLERVLDAAGADRADWIGYSMGGRLALGAAVLRPHRVDRLVLEGASPGLEDAEERAARRERDEALARDLERFGMEPFVDRWMALPLFATQRRLPADVLAAARTRRLDNAPPALAACLRGLGTGRQPSFWDVLDRVQAPTLLLTGALDDKFRRIADAMADRMPDARRADVPEAGHTAHLERPDGWLEAIEGFVG